MSFLINHILNLIFVFTVSLFIQIQSRRGSPTKFARAAVTSRFLQPRCSKMKKVVLTEYSVSHNVEVKRHEKGML